MSLNNYHWPITQFLRLALCADLSWAIFLAWLALAGVPGASPHTNSHSSPGRLGLVYMAESFQEYRASRSQCISTFQMFACVTFATVSLVKASHSLSPNRRGGEKFWLEELQSYYGSRAGKNLWPFLKFTTDMNLL